MAKKLNKLKFANSEMEDWAEAFPYQPTNEDLITAVGFGVEGELGYSVYNNDVKLTYIKIYYMELYLQQFPENQDYLRKFIAEKKHIDFLKKMRSEKKEPLDFLLSELDKDSCTRNPRSNAIVSYSQTESKITTYDPNYKTLESRMDILQQIIQHFEDRAAVYNQYNSKDQHVKTMIQQYGKASYFEKQIQNLAKNDPLRVIVNNLILKPRPKWEEGRYNTDSFLEDKRLYVLGHAQDFIEQLKQKKLSQFISDLKTDIHSYTRPIQITNLVKKMFALHTDYSHLQPHHYNYKLLIEIIIELGKEGDKDFKPLYDDLLVLTNNPNNDTKQTSQLMLDSKADSNINSLAITEFISTKALSVKHKKISALSDLCDAVKITLDEVQHKYFDALTASGKWINDLLDYHRTNPKDARFDSRDHIDPVYDLKNVKQFVPGKDLQQFVTVEPHEPIASLFKKNTSAKTKSAEDKNVENDEYLSIPTQHKPIIDAIITFGFNESELDNLTKRDITKRYYAKARESHPDKNINDSNAKEKTQELNLAKERLDLWYEQDKPYLKEIKACLKPKKPDKSKAAKKEETPSTNSSAKNHNDQATENKDITPVNKTEDDETYILAQQLSKILNDQSFSDKAKATKIKNALSSALHLLDNKNCENYGFSKLPIRQMELRINFLDDIFFHLLQVPKNNTKIHFQLIKTCMDECFKDEFKDKPKTPILTSLYDKSRFQTYNHLLLRIRKEIDRLNFSFYNPFMKGTKLKQKAMEEFYNRIDTAFKTKENTSVDEIINGWLKEKDNINAKIIKTPRLRFFECLINNENVKTTTQKTLEEISVQYGSISCKG